MSKDRITINGLTFLVPAPYTTGHPCTGAEAEILNRVLHNNLRKNFALIMDSYVPTGKSIEECNRELITLFGNYCAEYSLNGADPVEAEARAIALSVVKRKIKVNGGNVRDYSKAQLHTIATEVLKEQKQEIYDQARGRLKIIREAAAKELMKVSQ